MKPRFALLALGLFALPGPCLAQNLGRIDFPTSGTARAQEHFIEGVLYLHNFEFEDAVEAFVRAQETEAEFAMAYWGEAMAHNHPLWRQVDLEKGRAALKRLGDTAAQRQEKAKTAREKAYLSAVEELYGEGDKTERDRAYSDAMRRVYDTYPDDLEAAAFYALSLLGLTDGTRDFRNYMQAGAIAEEVFAKNPQHPGAVHYMIHSYDDPIHAPLGLRPARVYARIAPAASHAQHMVSHIFVAMGMWDEVVSANKKSFEIADERVKRKKLGVDDRNYHALLWLHYGLLQQGRIEDARMVLSTMEADTEKSGSERTRRHAALMRAAHIVDTASREPIDSKIDHGNLGATAVASDLFAGALLALESGKLEDTAGLLEKMSTLPRENDVEIMKMELEALLHLARGQGGAAIDVVRQAAEFEDKLAYEFGPPVPAKPAHELAGEMLLQLNRPGEAVEEFDKALLRTPRRTRSLLGLARAAGRAGDIKRAREAYAALHHIWRHADAKLPELAEVQAALSTTEQEGTHAPR